MSLSEPSRDLDHLLASAIYDSENTARLQEHPEELDSYLHRARELRRMMRVLGIDVAANSLREVLVAVREWDVQLGAMPDRAAG